MKIPVTPGLKVSSIIFITGLFLVSKIMKAMGFSVEDEISVKIGPMNNACRECAGPEVMSSSRVCASRKFLQSQKGREFDKRYTRAIKLLNNDGTTAVIECFGQIYSRSELVNVSMPFKNVTYPNR